MGVPAFPTVCAHLFVGWYSANSTQPWRDIRQKGLFIRSDGFTTSNCLFELEVATATRLFVGLHQEDSRVDGVSELRPYIDLGEKDAALHMQWVHMDCVVPATRKLGLGC